MGEAGRNSRVRSAAAAEWVAGALGANDASTATTGRQLPDRKRSGASSAGSTLRSRHAGAGAGERRVFRRHRPAFPACGGWGRTRLYRRRGGPCVPRMRGLGAEGASSFAPRDLRSRHAGAGEGPGRAERPVDLAPPLEGAGARGNTRRGVLPAPLHAGGGSSFPRQMRMKNPDR